MSNKPIGIFDSGVGGLSIFLEIHKVLPFENKIYLADSANAPYGEKSQTEIIELSVKNTELLLKKNCKIIVVACNTATTNGINFLRENYNIPFIGIEPAIKPAAIQTKTKSVGILATRGTLSSKLFHRTTNLYGSNIIVTEQIGEGIVNLIEEGKIETAEMENLLLKYIKPMVDANIDHLVLGCTHYPFLIPILKRLLPSNVKIIDSGEAVARQTNSILEKNGLLNNNKIVNAPRFFTNGKMETILNLLDHKYKVNALKF